MDKIIRRLLFIFILWSCDNKENVMQTPEGTVYIGKISTQIQSFAYTDYEINILSNGTRISKFKIDFISGILNVNGVQSDQQDCAFQRAINFQEEAHLLNQLRQLDLCRYDGPIYECAKPISGDDQSNIFTIIGTTTYSISKSVGCYSGVTFICNSEQVQNLTEFIKQNYKNELTTCE